MLIYCRLCDANRWVAGIDKARISTTARSEPYAFAAADSSFHARPISESADVRLWPTYAATTVLQPTAAATTADASESDTTNAGLPSVSSAHTPTKQDASRTTPAEPVEPIDINAAAANATHAAYAEPCTATRNPAIARTVPAAYPCSGRIWNHDRQVAITTQRSQAVPVRATSMGNTSRRLWQRQCQRDGDQLELVWCSKSLTTCS